MSKLKEIKKKYANCPILEHLEGIDIIGMDSKDKDYLIQQAERVQELEDEVEFLSHNFRIEVEQNKRYREVIKKAIDDLENECSQITLKTLEARQRYWSPKAMKNEL